MLTPAQIKNHQFSVSGKGTYAAAEVDSYINEIVASYEQMFKENGELVSKIGKLANRIEEYKADEDNIKEALLTAQRMADKITKEAKFAADSKTAEAEDTAKNTLATAKSEAEKIMSQAKEKAETALNEAQEKAEKTVSEAVLEVDKQRLCLEKSKSEVKEFKNKIMDMYKLHIERLQQIPEEVDEELQLSIKEKYAAPQTEAEQNDAADEGDYDYPQSDFNELDDILSDDEEEDVAYEGDDDDYDDDDGDGGFKVSLDNLHDDEQEEMEDISSSSNKIKFDSDAGLFGDEDDEEDDEEAAHFGSLFKRR